MEFEVGKLYKNTSNGSVVKCVIVNGLKGDYLAGVLMDKATNPWREGVEFTDWPEGTFEEYHEPKETAVTLQNGHKYNIPKGCKATITDDVIEIEEDIRYLKWSNGKKSKYFRVSSDKCLVVSKNENQPNVIWSLDSYATYNSNEVVNSTKEEFEEVYNKAMEALKL